MLNCNSYFFLDILEVLHIGLINDGQISESWRSEIVRKFDLKDYNKELKDFFDKEVIKIIEAAAKYFDTKKQVFVKSLVGK